MSGFEGFMTGFLNRTSEKIAERKDKASNYFDEQMERARTVGVDNLNQRREATNQTLAVARNLIDQAGMPEDIVRALANEGPEALNQAQQIYATAAQQGITVDASFWQNVYDFSTEMTASTNQSLEEFLGQVNGLYGTNLEATQQEGGDPFGAFIASGLGLNAMDRARSELDSTDISGGYSAGDLLAMDSRPPNTRPLGDTGYSGPDLSFLNSAAEDAQGVGAIFDPAEIARLTITFEEAAAKRQEELYQAYLQSGGDAELRTQESFKEEAYGATAQDWLYNLGPQAIGELNGVSKWLPTDGPSEEITTTVLPPTSGDPQEAGIGVDEPEVVHNSEEETGEYQPPAGVAPVVYDSETGEEMKFVRLDANGNYVFSTVNSQGEVNTFVATPQQYQDNIASGQIRTTK